MSSFQKNKNVFQFIYFSAIILFGSFGLVFLTRISVPLSIAYVCYLMISPLIPIITKICRSRNIAVTLILIVFSFLAILPIFLLIPSLKSEIDKIQYYLPRLEGMAFTKFVELKSLLVNEYGIVLDENIFNETSRKVKEFSAFLVWNIPTFLANALEWLFLVPLFLFFLMKESNTFTRMLLRITPNNIFERFYHLLHQINTKIGDYIFAKFIEASIVGVIITAGLWVLDIKFWALFGLLAGITNIIPYIGPILGAVPALGIVYFEAGISASLGASFILYLIANTIDMAIVFPLLVSKIVDLHPLAVVVSVIAGSQFFGFVGMIISVPIVAAIKLILLEFYKEIYSPI